MEFQKGNQKVWFHLAQDKIGIFHTFDNFQPSPKFPPRKIHIFLPIEYEQCNEKYKVVYMNDGNTIFWKGGAFNKTWNLLKVLSDLYGKNLIEKLIIVAIEPIDRESEYTHDKVFSRNSGNVDNYAYYLALILKPFIDQNYRTQLSGKDTSIIGSSHGGLAAFYIATRYPASFGIGICLSSSFWVGVDSSISIYPFKFPYVSSLKSSSLIAPVKNVLMDPSIRPKLYIDYGLVRTGGFHNYLIEDWATRRSKEAIKILLEYGYTINEDLFVCEDKFGSHEEDSWHCRMYNILPLFYKKKN